MGSAIAIGYEPDPARPPASLSVIIPTHRDRGFIKATVSSVLSQMNLGDEVVIVPNGCSDEYFSWLREEFGEQCTIHEAPVAGIAAARNWGRARAGGSLLMFLDDDDILAPGAIGALKRYLQKTPGAAAVLGRIHFFSHGSPTCADVDRGAELEILSMVDVFKYGPPCTSPGAAIIRAAAFDLVGGFRQQFAPADDWDLWLQLASLSEIHRLPRVTLQYRMHDARTTLQIAKMLSAALSVYGEHQPKLPPTNRAAALTGLLTMKGWYLPQLRESSWRNLRRGRISDAFTDLVAAARLIVRHLKLRVEVKGLSYTPSKRLVD